jgi:GH15 family glucan-1,4-alpha-glucosidase
VRTDGYAPIADYAAIGDGRTVALVARDGSIDWLCLPNMDSASVFAALLDAERGGRFALAPTVPFEVERRYVPDTNILETMFSTAEGAVRVTDVLTLPGAGRLAPGRELARRIEGLAGKVPMSWRVEPRFGYASRPARIGTRAGVLVADDTQDAVAVLAWDAGEAEVGPDVVRGRFEVRDGTKALLTLAASHQEPLVFPGRDDVEKRIDATAAFWRGWTGDRSYDGPWKESVLRSALALKLLVYAPSGAIVAAPTSSLPEEIGGGRNWDYRFCWIRDSAFALDALLEIGCSPEAHAFFWWMLHASQRTHPRLHVLYRLDGDERAPERVLPLAGYRGSGPVRIGNEAAGQTQLDVYGDLVAAAWLYSRRGNAIDRDTGRRLAEVADHVCEIWREPDAGIWEVRSEPRHFTHSKMMCFVALDRACRLADASVIPAEGKERWRREAEAVRAFVESECFSAAKRAYVRAAGDEDLDASVLLGSLMEYCRGDTERMKSTIEAIRRELGHGPFLYRYSGEDGLPGEEGSFLACAFWLAEALARAGRSEEAAEEIDALLPHANDVGLFAEEVDPRTGEQLGNFPQGLTHLALIGAAVAVAEGQA